jgi:hypothetical protein
VARSLAELQVELSVVSWEVLLELSSGVPLADSSIGMLRQAQLR